MNVETLLRSTVPMLGSLHILGAESDTMSAAIKNIKIAINAIEKAREEAQHADCNEQREDV